METDDQRAALARLIEQRGESYAALSRLIGRNDAYLQQFVRRGSPRRLEERDRRMLARYLGVADAVLGGPAEAQLAEVPRLDIAAAAGAGRVVDGEAVQAVLRFDAAFLRRLGVRAASASVIRVTGDSMEPTLRDGDEILVDRDQFQPGPDPRLFVLRLDGLLAVKRVRLIAEGVEVASDNPAYPPFVLPPAEAQPIGRVIWLGRTL